MPVNKITRVSTKVEEEITGYVCNACGQETSGERGGIHTLAFSGRYYSTYPDDLETIDMVICDGCLEAWANTFKVPVKRKNLLDHSDTHRVQVGDVKLWWCPMFEVLMDTEEEVRAHNPDWDAAVEPYSFEFGIYEHGDSHMEIMGRGFRGSEEYVIYRPVPGQPTHYEAMPLANWQTTFLRRISR